jgi:hypothetical protein
VAEFLGGHKFSLGILDHYTRKEDFICFAAGDDVFDFFEFDD